MCFRAFPSLFHRFHRPDGGLPQTGPADRAGAQEHRHPAPDQLHQGDDRSGQRVRRTAGTEGEDDDDGDDEVVIVADQCVMQAHVVIVRGEVLFDKSFYPDRLQQNISNCSYMQIFWAHI